MGRPNAEAEPVLSKLITNIERVIIGKRAAVELAVIALVCGRHLLMEDVPGTAKTMLARSLAQSISGNFKRIQFTPDMLPSDVTGISIYNPKNQEFGFREGPVFANVVLADEINRATPKTQSALLEAMSDERQVTVDGITRKLEPPFLVIATQNPIEQEGTFPLPEAQLDRFLLRMSIGYPSRRDEVEMLQRQKSGAHPIFGLEPVVDLTDILEMQKHLDAVHLEDMIFEYIVDIVSYTREHSEALGLELGASPRGSLALARASRARALLQGRDYVLPEDVKALAVNVLAHRIIPRPGSGGERNLSESQRAAEKVKEVIAKVPAPGNDTR